MRVKHILFAGLATAVLAMPARAALVLEYIQVGSINAGPSNGPALAAALTINQGESIFLQVALRDTLGSGPDAGQPGTIPWQTNGGAAGAGSLGLGSFFVRFDGIAGVAVNPAPLSAANQRLIPAAAYGLIAAGSSPPAFTNYGGLLNFGSEPGAVPDPALQNRIALFNLRVQGLAVGSGIVRLRDPNPSPTTVDNSVLLNADPFGTPSPGTVQSIDDLLFGPSSLFSYDLPVVVTPEPTSLVLAGLGVMGLAGRRLRKKAH